MLCRLNKPESSFESGFDIEEASDASERAKQDANGVQVDRDGNGMLTPEAIALFLDDLALDPTGHEVKLIMRDLDPRKEGFVTREDFMHFMRTGGRRQRPGVAASLEKRLSIELDADKLEAAIEGAHSVGADESTCTEGAVFLWHIRQKLCFHVLDGSHMST